jgi:hypothetical protein
MHVRFRAARITGYAALALLTGRSMTAEPAVAAEPAMPPEPAMPAVVLRSGRDRSRTLDDAR